jgi:hypothetical protein
VSGSCFHSLHASHLFSFLPCLPVCVIIITLLRGEECLSPNINLSVGVLDPYHRSPHTALLFNDYKCLQKSFFIGREFTSDVKDNRLFRSHNTVEIKVCLHFFACMLGFGAGPEHTNYNGFGSGRPKSLRMQLSVFLILAIITLKVIVFFGCSKGGFVSRIVRVLALEQNSPFCKEKP